MEQEYDFMHIVSLGYNCEIANSIIEMKERDAAYPLDCLFSRMWKINETMKQRFSNFFIRENLIKAAEKMAEESKGMTPDKLLALGQALTVLSVPQAAAKEIIDTAATATVDGAESIRAKKTNDLVATPTGYGDRILLAGEDTFALNNDDTIVAGTNLFPQQSSGGNNTVAKLDELIKAIHNQTRVLSSRDNTFGAGINSAYYG
jgi:hypothetical protein